MLHLKAGLPRGEVIASRLELGESPRKVGGDTAPVEGDHARGQPLGDVLRELDIDVRVAQDHQPEGEDHLIPKGPQPLQRVVQDPPSLGRVEQE